MTAVFVMALLAGVFLPVYTDEIGWRFQERAGFDGVDKMFSDVCGPNSLAVPPPFMWPVRLYSAFFNGHFADPMWVRFSGIAYAMAWVAMAFVLLGRASDGLADAVRTRLPLVCFGLLSLGTMPFLMVWSRPEQPIVLAITGALLLATADWRDPHQPTTGSAESWRRSLGVLVLASISVSYHVKGVVAVPIFVACLFFASRGRMAHVPRMACATVMVGVTGWAAWYWVHRLQCPDDPVLRAAYAVNNMGVVLTGPDGKIDPVPALFKLFGNISLTAYFGLPTPREIPLSFWLEPYQIGKAASFRWFLALIAVWSIASVLAALAMIRGGAGMLRARRLEPWPSLAIVLFGTVLAWSATQLIRNFYEACFVLPVLALAIAMALPSLPQTGGLKRAGDLVAGVVGICALLSIAAVASIYGPSLVRANAQQGYIAAQPNSLPVFGYGAVRNDIAALARQCRIPQGPQARAVMVDDLTYFAFMQSYLPQHRLGVLGVWKGSITDPVAYLKSRGSSGLLVGCHLLPPELQARARRQGKFCCLAPPNW